MLLGDFNSVTEKQDRLSQQMDRSSASPNSILEINALKEPLGSHLHSFTYHHPSILKRKSRLDRIYLNYYVESIRGYSSFVTFSDHFLVGLRVLPPDDLGPKPWHFPVDLLSQAEHVEHFGCILDLFNTSDPMDSWERIKMSIQGVAKHATSFIQKQIKLEIMALKKSLRQINNRIYASKNLDLDSLLLQDRISQIKDRNFFLQEPEQELDWIVSEGKPVSSFLNLEQNKSTQGIQSLSVDGDTTLDVSIVLPVIKDFYESLYFNHDTKAQ